MCGRFALYGSMEALKKQFKITDHFKFVNRYNIAPSEMIPVITGGEPHLAFMRWGFIPKWAKQKGDTWPSAYINARSETLFEKPTFKQAIKKQRCLVPCSGYYEWKSLHDKKQPFYINLPTHGFMGLAGIWETWASKEGAVDTFALLTTESQGPLKRLHDRMPVIISQTHYDAWLNAKTPLETVEHLLNDFPDTLELQPVSPKVNHPKFDDPSCIQSL